MQRSIVDAVPTPAAPASDGAAATAIAPRGPMPRWFLVFGFWTLIVLAYSTRREVRVGPYHWVERSWLDAFKAAAAQWYAWGLLSGAIYWVNRTLPVGGVANAAAAGQATSQPAGRGGGGASAPAPGVLLGGVYGTQPLPVDGRGWGWMTQSYVSGGYKRPFWNKAKELLFSGKQVTSYTISSFDTAFYCEVRKHYGFVWFEMQHSTMSWDEVAKMLAACPGPDGAAPMIRMPDQFESSIQKATDLGAIGLIFPTVRDGHQALEAARYSRFPPAGRRSSGSGQAARVWANAAGGYQNTYNDNVLVVVMLETLDGILSADEIANTFGIDVVIQGNNDLSRFSGWAQDDPRYQSMLTVSRNATLRAGKFWGNAGQQYLTGNPLSPDVRFVQNGPSMDGWTPPSRGRGGAEEPTIGVPGGRGGGPGR